MCIIHIYIFYVKCKWHKQIQVYHCIYAIYIIFLSIIYLYALYVNYLNFEEGEMEPSFLVK